MTHLSTQRKPRPTLEHLSTVCFRVTRQCNMACPFCQAPPNGNECSPATLIKVLRWLSEHGTRSVKFTGGEPLMSPHWRALVAECRSLGMEPTVVTNATALEKTHMRFMRQYGVRVKISLHGPQRLHNRLTASRTFSRILSAIRSAVGSGLNTSIHTLLMSPDDLDMERWIAFLAQERLSKVTFLPFVPRGRGSGNPRFVTLSADRGRLLANSVHRLAEKYEDLIIVRYLDLLTESFISFETDGRFYVQEANEEADKMLNLPDLPKDK